MAAALSAEVDAQTASFICSWRGDAGYELVFIPRTQRHSTRPSLRCIKSEFVGILEMGGFGILPGRLAAALPRLGTLAEAAPGKSCQGQGAFCLWLQRW